MSKDLQFTKDMNAVDVKGLGSKYYSGEPLVALGDKKAENAVVEWKENKEKLNAVMYLACAGEGFELGEEQKANVDKYLGQGVFENFIQADKDLQNEQLKQFAIQGWTGQEGISWLDEAELAEAMGLKSSHASEFAGKFREQARIVIEENNRVLAEKQIGLDFVKEKIRNGQFVDSGKAEYEKFSPEANHVISQLATAADMAAKLIYKWAYDEDADDNYSGGGPTGFRIKGANAWHGFVKELAELKRKNPMAYELALEAMNQMVADDHKNHGVWRAFMPDFMVDMPLEIGDKLGIKEYQEGLMEITSRIPAQVVTGLADAGQAALNKIQDVFVENEIPEGFEEQLKAGKLGDKYSFEDWFFDKYKVGVMGGMPEMTYEDKKFAIIFSKEMDSQEKRDAKWKEYVQEMYDRQLKSVLADLQAVKDARWQSTAEEGGVRAFVQDSLDVVGAAIPFILTRGVASGINEADKAQNKYVSEGAGSLEAAQAGAGEGVAHVLTNIWGLGTFGGGQYAGGYVRKWWDLAFNKLQNKVGTKNLLGKVIKQDEWVRRIGFVGLESAVLHGQTLAEPYTRAVGGRLFSDGQLGKRWEEAHKEFDEVATWRNYFTALPMSVLFGMMPGNGRSKHRSIGIAEATVREMQLDVAESRECMEGLGMEEADIKAVLSEGDSTKRVELLHEGIKKVELKDAIDKGGDSVLFIPEKSLPMQLAELGEIPTFEMIDDNTVRIYEKGEGEESSYRDMPLQEANAYLNYLAMKWLIKQRERVQDLLNESNEATVEYFAKKLGIEFKESKEKFSIEHLTKLANEAFARAYDLERELSKAEARFDRQNNPEPFGEREAKMRQDLEDALAMQSVPTSFRQRVELAIQRGESTEENAGELEPAAMNYLLPCGKKVIRYYNGDCTPLELLEEVIELWVKGEVVNGRPKEFFLEGLKESQAYLLGNGGLKDGELLIADNLLFDGKADSELTDLERKMRDKALIEGMSMLAKSVYVGDLANQKNLPSVVRRFMLYLRAVVEKVMDMLNLAGTFKAGVEAGAINRDFADFVYEACGSDFASARAEATTYGMQKELREMVEGVNNALAGGDELGLKSHGPGGRDLRVFREDVVRDSDKLAEILKKKQGEIIYNEKLDIKARISGQTKGKAGHARMSVANLKRFGISEKDARIIHYTAAARIDELFKNAEYGFFEYSYKNDRSRKGAYHAFTTIEIEGYGVFDVNISAVQAIQLKDGSFLFTLEATIENPSSNSALLPSSLRGAAGKATGITERKLSAYRSFVEKEMMYIKKNAEKAGVFMKAPNGKNSNLSERLWCVVRTKAFKGWFGDWENDPENASKVVDENGEPMVMYHGSPTRGIKVFEMNEALFGEGAFFTNVAEEALDYTGLELLDYEDVGKMDEAAVEQGLLYEVFLNIRDEDRVYERNGGIHARAISPNEIKSATDNRGTFDVGSWDITMALVDGSIRGELEAGLVNASEYVADYWGKVDARLGKELESIEKLLSRGVIDDRAKAVMMEARAALRVAVESLPNSSYKEAMMKKLATVDEHLQSVALSRLGSTEYKEVWLLHRVGQFYKEIAEGVRMCASVELTKELKALLTYHNGSVDEKTGMWRKSKIGAEGVRFLRQVIIPAFEATVEDADRKVDWLEMQVATLKPDELGLKLQHDDVEFTKMMREYLWWQKYGGLFEGESSLEVLVAAQKELNAFLQEHGERWNKSQVEKAKKIKRQQNSLVAELTVNVNHGSIHNSQEDFHLSHMDKNGKLREGVWNSMLQNPVRQIELWASREGKGKKFFSWFLKQFVKASDAVSYEMVAEQKRMNERLKSVFRAKDQSELDKALVRWGCEEVEIKEKLTPLIEQKIQLNVDEAEAIVKGEQESSFNEGEKELIRRKLFLYEQTHGTSGMIEFVVYRDGQGEELNVPKLTRDQMLFVLMSMNQPGAYNTWDGSLSPMRKKGWNDAIKAELESLVGAEGQYLMNVLFEGYAMQGDKIRPLYEARYGMPFSERRTYSPLRWVVADTKSDVDLASVMGDTGLVQVTRADSFIMARRMDHSRFLDTSVGALQLYWKSFAQTNNWVHTQGVLETVRAILSDKDVAEKLNVNMGGMDYRGFQVLLNQLEHGGRDISAQFDMSEIHKNSLINIRAIGHLAGALTTITKNTTTILNALHGCDLSIAEWVVALGRVLNGTSKIGVRELFDSNVFQARRETYTYGHLLGIKKTFGGRLGRAEQLTDWYMRLMNNVDAGGNAVSFAAAFDHYFREGERNKMTSGEAMDYAWEKIEVGLATAQPINWVTSPALMRNSRGAGNFNLYLMGENLQKLGTFTNLWARGEFKLAMRSWLLSGLGMQVIGYLVNMCMRPGHEEEDEKNVLKYIPGILLGPLNGFPALGYGLGYGFDKLYEAVTGEKGGFKYTTGVVGNELVLRIKEFSRAWNTLSEWDDAKDIRDKASALASAANVVATACGFRTPRGSQVINVAQAVSGVAHSVRDLMGISMSPFTAEACDILFDTRAKEKAEREERIKARAKRFRELRER